MIIMISINNSMSTLVVLTSYVAVIGRVEKGQTKVT